MSGVAVPLHSYRRSGRIRPETITRKNALFAGSDGGGRAWATLATLLNHRKNNVVRSLAWLEQTLERHRQRLPNPDIEGAHGLEFMTPERPRLRAYARRRSDPGGDYPVPVGGIISLWWAASSQENSAPKSMQPNATRTCGTSGYRQIGCRGSGDDDIFRKIRAQIRQGRRCLTKDREQMADVFRFSRRSLGSFAHVEPD